MMSSMRARGIEQRRRHCAARRGALAQHGHQRHHAGTAGDQEQRAAEVGRPDEIAADRPAQLEAVAGARFAGKIGRHLALGDALDGERQCAGRRRRGDRIAALRLIAVLGGEPHVDMLAGFVARPLRHIEHQAAHARRLLDDLAQRRDHPLQPLRRSILLAHDLIRKPVPTFRDHALSRRHSAARARDRRRCDSRAPPKSRAARCR